VVTWLDRTLSGLVLQAGGGVDAARAFLSVIIDFH
jgi:hypothetical protein